MDSIDVVHQPKVLDVEAQDSPETASSLDHEEKLVEGTVPQHVPPTVVEPAVELTRLSESNVAHVREVLLIENESLSLLSKIYYRTRSSFYVAGAYVISQIDLNERVHGGADLRGRP